MTTSRNPPHHIHSWVELVAMSEGLIEYVCGTCGDSWPLDGTDIKCQECGSDRFYCYSESTRPIVCDKCNAPLSMDTEVTFTLKDVKLHPGPVSK